MLHIGCHLSSSGGFYKMGETALKIGADTFQFFTRNPRGSKAKEIDPNDAKKLLELMEENRFPFILAHAPYTLNPCSARGWISLRIRCTIFTPAAIQGSEPKRVLS